MKVKLLKRLREHWVLYKDDAYSIPYIATRDGELKVQYQRTYEELLEVVAKVEIEIAMGFNFRTRFFEKRNIRRSKAANRIRVKNAKQIWP